MESVSRYEVQKNDKLGRYLSASKDLKPGEKILSDEPLALGPHGGAGLVCFACHRPLISKFVCCKTCGVAPVCPDGCGDSLTKYHSAPECDLFKQAKASRGVHTFALVQNVQSLLLLRALLRRGARSELLELEGHLDQRRGTDVWTYYEEAEKFIESLGLLEGEADRELVQRVAAVVDVNSFEVRGPPAPGIGCSEVLRGVYPKAALLAHDCTPNTQISVNNNNLLVCHATVDIKKGEPIYYNYTDALKGTALRQQHLQLGKYFTCSCARCGDPSERGAHVSSVRCARCPGLAAEGDDGQWRCAACDHTMDAEIVQHRVRSCAEKFRYINKKDEHELEEYIRNVSLVLAPSHYLLLDAKQRLAGALRDAGAAGAGAGAGAGGPGRRALRRLAQLCAELEPVLDALTPGISRTKAITLYEHHASIVQLSKKLFDGREIDASAYMDELLKAESLLKRALEMLFIEPGNSPEGELCARALEEFRVLKSTIEKVMDSIHAEGKTYVSQADREQPLENAVSP